MEVKTIKKTTKELELEIIDENETILNPLTHVLTNHEDVEYAACMYDHPLSDRRKLYIRVKKGKPEEILKKAVEQLQNEVIYLQKQITGKTKTSSKK